MKKNQYLPLLGLLSLFTFFACTKDNTFQVKEGVMSKDSSLIKLEQAFLDMNCDTSNATYSSFMVPLLTDHCFRCHSGEAPFGGVHLDNYEGVKKVVDQGRLYGAVTWQGPFENMPQGEEQLPICDLANIRAWINAGAPNN